MRPSPAHSLSSEEPQLSSTTTPTCNTRACRWRPYSDTNEFEANAAIIVIVLISALISALSLNAAIRCFLRTPERQQEAEERKTDPEAAVSATVVVPTVVYSSGVKLAGAEAECAICLSEFVEGESIRVLGRCDHGFHVKCIQKWLSTHASCPTCRTSIHQQSTHHCSASVSLQQTS